MSRRVRSQLKPVVSLALILGALFSVVFVKMEVRRMGYEVLKDSREFRKVEDHMRLRSLEYAQITRPQRVRSLAVSQLTLQTPQSGQIIQLSGAQIALTQ